MNTLRLRFWLFILGCIGSRSIITLLAYHASCHWLRLMGLLALLPVLGWFYILFIGRRDTGLEVFGDRIWWNSLRPAHLLLWGFFSYLAVVKCHPFAWVPLAIDTLLGLSSFLIYHGLNGHLPTMLGM